MKLPNPASKVLPRFSFFLLPALPSFLPSSLPLKTNQTEKSIQNLLLNPFTKDFIADIWFSHRIFMFLFLKNNFIYLAMLGLRRHEGCSLVAVHRLVIAAASLDVERGL